MRKSIKVKQLVSAKGEAAKWKYWGYGVDADSGKDNGDKAEFTSPIIRGIKEPENYLFTGISDSAGKDIYEKDVIMCDFKTDNGLNHRRELVAVYDAACGRVVLLSDIISYPVINLKAVTAMQVIGHVADKPDNYHKHFRWAA